jgi:hypothetical protein
MTRKLISILLLLFLLPVSRQETHSEGKLNVSDRLKIKLRRTYEYSWGCSGVDEEEPEQALAIPPLSVPNNRLLVTVCDSLYMLDSSGDVIWHWATGSAGIVAQPVIDSTRTIHVIALDLIKVDLDAETGLVKWEDSGSNGKWGYSQMKPYVNDQYLVIIDNSNYRDSFGSIRYMPDSILLYKGTEQIASADFPAEARLEVWGDRILAISHRKDGMKIQQIKMHKEEFEEK